MQWQERGPRRWGRFRCALGIMLAILFAMVHSLVAWHISGWWPQVLRLPPSAPARVVFTLYWWPPMQLLGIVTNELEVPQGGITNLMLLPLAWLTCFIYGWVTAIAVCLPFRIKQRR